MKRLAVKRLAGASALALAWLAATPAAAQTVIVPDTGPVRSTGTVTDRQGAVTSIDGGTRVGDNLFHSFTRFDLGGNDSAVWLRSAGDGASVANVINRVTGGGASFIDGHLETQGLPNADFYFLNPAGVIFGAAATVAIPNAVHFSTAGVLNLADGGSFRATTPAGSTLSIAAPQSFGFLGGQGDVVIDGVDGRGFSMMANMTIIDARPLSELPPLDDPITGGGNQSLSGATPPGGISGGNQP